MTLVDCDSSKSGTGVRYFEKLRVSAMSMELQILILQILTIDLGYVIVSSQRISLIYPLKILTLKKVCEPFNIDWISKIKSWIKYEFSNQIFNCVFKISAFHQ